MHENNEQKIIVVSNSEEHNHIVKESLSGLENINLCFFNDPCFLLKSNEFKQADIFVVSCDLGNYDGRQLYFEQRNRIRIVPFLFLSDKHVTDDDWKYLYRCGPDKNLFDYLEKPYSCEKLKHRINLMLTITHMYNTYTINTIDDLREFWKESIRRDREILNSLTKMYDENKE